MLGCVASSHTEYKLDGRAPVLVCPLTRTAPRPYGPSRTLYTFAAVGVVKSSSAISGPEASPPSEG